TSRRISWSSPPPAHPEAASENRSETPTGRRPPGSPPRFQTTSLPLAIFIQCACDTSHRDGALADLQADFQQDLHHPEADSQATLASLRTHLLVVTLATFLAAVVGGFWLVPVALSPLRRLSEAVSRVSPRDFRLQFDEPRLPYELNPIVDRLTQTLDMLQ